MTKFIAFVAALLLCGCDPVYLDLSSCETSEPGPDCPKQETCPGQCVPIPPYGWELPGLLWFGPALEAPACPAERAPVVGYEGHADPIDPPECPACTCEPPIGECALPSIMTAHAEPGCMGMTTDFSPPASWDGTCNDDIMIPVGQGPASMLVEPLALTERGCKPPDPLPPKGDDSSWRTFARACRGFGFSPCLDPGMLCVPTAEPPPQGFSQCIFQKGELECPAGYPNRHVFYDDIEDSRRCSACWCGPPEGGVCSSNVSLFLDASCSAPQTTAFLDSLSPQCLSPLGGLGTALGSKEATSPVYTPGSCEPMGGEPLGSVELTGPSTFCCQ